jgi:hypothetical protein
LLNSIEARGDRELNFNILSLFIPPLPPATKLGWVGVYWIQRVRPSVFCFPDIFRINYADNEMKLGRIVYNNELQIKFELRHYWLILDWVMTPGLRIFMKILFSGHFQNLFCRFEMKPGMIVYKNVLQIKFEFCCYWSIFDRVIALGRRIFMKITVFRTFLKLISLIWKWNLVWLSTIISYRSSLSFVVIYQYLTELWPLDSEFS